MPQQEQFNVWTSQTWNASTPGPTEFQRVKIEYDGKGIIPGPLLSIQRVSDVSPDGTVRSRGWKGRISGQLLSHGGSPDNDGNFWEDEGYPAFPAPPLNEEALARLLKKKAALTQLFSVDGKWYEITAGDGETIMRFQPRFSEITFEEGKWYNVINYGIDFTCDFVEPNDNSDWSLQKNFLPEESWQVEQSDEEGRVYRLVHTVSGFGRNRYDSNGAIVAKGWEVARDMIIGGPLAGGGAVNFLGFQSTKLQAPGVLGLTGFSPYNYRRSLQIDEGSGRVTVVETWECVDPTNSPSGLTGGAAIEEFSVENRYSGDNGNTAISVSGTIRGLEIRNDTNWTLVTTRQASADARAAGLNPTWLHTKAESESGLSLNPIPTSITISKNKVSGVYSYQATFDDRVGYGVGNISESIEVIFDNAVDVVATIPVPFRVAGPILQGMSTVTQKTITIRAEIQKASTFSSNASIPVFNPLPIALAAIGSTPAQMFVVQDQPTWNLYTGRYTRSTTYLYQG